jgi:hypothetical protein
MIDLAGTGFSKPGGDAEGEDFWGVDQDIESGRHTARRRPCDAVQPCRLRGCLGPLFSRRLLVRGRALRQFVLGDIFHVRGDGPHMPKRIFQGA